MAETRLCSKWGKWRNILLAYIAIVVISSVGYYIHTPHAPRPANVRKHTPYTPHPANVLKSTPHAPRPANVLKHTPPTPHPANVLTSTPHAPCPADVHKQLAVCPLTIYNDNSSSITDGQTDTPKVNCALLFTNNNDAAVRMAKSYQSCTANPAYNLACRTTESCQTFIARRGYNSYKVTPEEQDFPLAFSLLTYDNLEQTERLLRAVYRPHNVYCIHVDQSSDPAFYQSLAQIVSCLENVFMSSHRFDVVWGKFTVLQAEISCMEQLLKRNLKWRYFINLTGREFPLRTNWELVHILMAYNGSNDIWATHTRRRKDWTDYYYANSVKIKRPPPPFNFKIYKGSAHIVVCRGFVEYAVNHDHAQKLLKWMEGVIVPDEHFFSMLNMNPDKGIPGAYTGDPETKPYLARYKRWADENPNCSGTIRNSICNFGVGELSVLGQVKDLFANKFHIETDWVAYDCMEKWYMNRLRHEPNPDFDVEFYRKQPWVTHHV